MGMQLAHTMLRVKDLDATLAFYTEFLGSEGVAGASRSAMRRRSSFSTTTPATIRSS